MKVEPVRLDAIPKLRIAGEEFPTEAVPVEFRKVSLGHFEGWYKDKWRPIRGSYMSVDGPMVWVEVDA